MQPPPTHPANSLEPLARSRSDKSSRRSREKEAEMCPPMFIMVPQPLRPSPYMFGSKHNDYDDDDDDDDFLSDDDNSICMNEPHYQLHKDDFCSTKSQHSAPMPTTVLDRRPSLLLAKSFHSVATVQSSASIDITPSLPTRKDSDSDLFLTEGSFAESGYFLDRPPSKPIRTAVEPPPVESKFNLAHRNSSHLDISDKEQCDKNSTKQKDDTPAVDAAEQSPSPQPLAIPCQTPKIVTCRQQSDCLSQTAKTGLKDFPTEAPKSPPTRVSNVISPCEPSSPGIEPALQDSQTTGKRVSAKVQALKKTHFSQLNAYLAHVDCKLQVETNEIKSSLS